ncbi:MAG: hypothetical protein JWQ18_1027 [Conexibacter sp.]|nr:hypothetical protein [Conexibacter sp.]
MVRRCMRVRAGVLLALTLAVVVAGCGGGDDHSGYVKALNKAQTELASRFTALQSRITPTSDAAQDSKTLLAYEAAVTTTVGDLRAVDPPAGLAPLHRRFVAEVTAYGAALRKARGELSRDDPRAILAAQGRLRSAVAATGRQLNATIQAINRKLEG